MSGKPKQYTLEVPNVLTQEKIRAILREASTFYIVCPECGEHHATDIHHRNGNHSDNRPENLTAWCKRCHNEHHGITDNLTMLTLMYREYDAIQGHRIAAANRLRAYAELGYEAERADKIRQELEDLERHTQQALAAMIKHEPVWHYYLSKILGVGPVMGAALMSEIGDPARFNTVSDLWSYCGLDVRNGKGRKRARGETANWHHNLRMIVIGRLVPGFIRLKGRGDCFGRQLYDRYKAYYQERDGDTITPLHIENRARRKVGKVFLACFWAAWMRVKGKEPRNPYAMDRLPGHTHLVTPEDWAGEDWFSTPAQLSFSKQILEQAAD